MTAMLWVSTLVATALLPTTPERHGPGPAADSSQLVAWHQALRSLRPDPARGTTVEGLVLERDAARFHLDRGTLHLIPDFDGRTYGAVFSGEGRFEVAIPDPLEAAHVPRAFDVSVEGPVSFRNAVFLFNDLTLTELEPSGGWAPLEPSGDARDEASEASAYLSGDDGWIDRTVTLPLVNGAPGFFYAHFSERRDEPLMFTIDLLEAEEIGLHKRSGRDKRREVMSRFHRRLDYESGRSLPQEALDIVTITAYDIETEIDDDLDIVGRAEATLFRRQLAYDWVPFQLYSGLDVDSVRWSDGSPVPFYRPDDRADLWVDLRSMPSDTASLAFHYSGEMMDRPEDLWVRLWSHTTWYPVYEHGRPIPYTLTFHAPDDYVVTTVGERTHVETVDERTTSVFETPAVRAVTFNIGEFDALEAEAAYPDDPELTVLINERAHRRLGGMVAEAGGYLLQQRDMADMVAHDLRNSFTFFNGVYGPTTVRSFVATEIPYSHGEAYPGLVMLAWNTFQWTSEEGFDEMFRAHEVAHQWWGIGVRPATYRDWWLAEGFSEFSGWWYAARARGSIDMYLRRLKETREGLLDRRGESPPIALGTRSATSENPGDYQMTVYHKGAWVLHMLRTLMTDTDTGSDSLFTGMMRSFYNDHLGRTATTQSFQNAVEEALGGSMQWFFDAWVHGSDIPTYTFSHDFEERDDGSVLAHVRIRQERVPDDFRMFVPILVDFGEEGTAMVRVDVSGPVTEVTLPAMPRVPDRLEFNPFEAVLAETRTEGWRD